MLQTELNKLRTVLVLVEERVQCWEINNLDDHLYNEYKLKLAELLNNIRSLISQLMALMSAVTDR